MMLNVVSPLFLCFGFAKHKRLKIGEIGTCIAAAMSLLASYCIIKARQNAAQAADSEDPSDPLQLVCKRRLALLQRLDG
jgi:hypothetical protein